MNPCTVRTLVIIIIVITIAVAFMYYIHAKQFIKNSSYNEKSRIINALSKQAAEFAITSKKDNNPIRSLVMADYAVSNLLSLKNVASNEEIKAIMGIEFSQLQEEIVTIQNAAIKKITMMCTDSAKNNKQY